MLHGTHRFHTFHNPRHFLAAFAIIIIPIIVLLAAGYLTHVPWADLLLALNLSLWRLAVAYFISLLVGATLALLVGASPWGENLLPLFDVLQNIPSFALIPVFAAALGYSSGMIVAFAATAVIWPIMFYAASAIRMTRQELNDAATIFGAVGGKRLRYYLLPLSFPALITGSIVGVSIGWEAVIGAEIIGNQPGIGTFLNIAGASGNNKLLGVGLLALLVVVFIISRLIWLPLLKANQHLLD